MCQLHGNDELTLRVWCHTCVSFTRLVVLIRSQPVVHDLVDKTLNKTKNMSDIQLETPSNGAEKESIDQVDAVKIEENVNEVTASKQYRRPQYRKKQRYDGRKKKRNWEFNKRDDEISDEKRMKMNPEDKIRRRKFCVILGYAGANYIGMQRNPDVNTIEEELLKALLKNELITDEAFNQPQYTHFQRAARTDKGVSAARQCISLKLRKFRNFSQIFLF